MASRYTIGYNSSSGRLCQAFTSSRMASVTLEIRVGGSGTPRSHRSLPGAPIRGFSESAAWAEVERLGLNKLINEARSNGKVSFGYIASYYLENRNSRQNQPSTCTP